MCKRENAIEWGEAYKSCSYYKEMKALSVICKEGTGYKVQCGNY